MSAYIATLSIGGIFVENDEIWEVIDIKETDAGTRYIVKCIEGPGLRLMDAKGTVLLQLVKEET